MKRLTSKKSAPVTAAKVKASGHRKGKAIKASAKQSCAQMPEYLLEEHPELGIESCPGIHRANG